MDLVEILQKRYSCRNYIKKDVNDEDVKKIIDYASLAPSAGNLQPWKVIIVTSKEKRESLSIACMNQSWMKQAPVYLVICSNEDYIKNFYKAKGELYSKQDCAAFIQTILLLATEMGLASCWVGAFEEKMIKRELEIPDNLVVYAVITLGYSNEKNPDSKKRYDSQTFTFFEKYGNRIQNKSILSLANKIPTMQEKNQRAFNKMKEGLLKHSK